MPRTRGQIRAMAQAEDADHAEGEDTDGDDGLLYLDNDSDYNLDIHDNESSVIASFLRNLMRRSISRMQNNENDPLDLDSDDSNYSEILTPNLTSSRFDNSSDEYEPVNGSDCDTSDDQARNGKVGRARSSESVYASSSAAMASGVKRRRSKFVNSSLPTLISQRQLHGTKAGSAEISCHLLPNTGHTLNKHGTKGFCVKFDREARVLVHAAQDNNVRIYDCSGGSYELARTVNAQDVGWSIVAVDISYDGNVVAYSSWSDAIRTFTIPYEEKGKTVRSIPSKSSSTSNNIHHETLPLNPPHTSLCLFSLCFSSDASEIIGGANDRCLYIYNRERNERTGRILVHDDDVNAVAFACAPNLIVTGGDDGIVKTWDRRVLNESLPTPCGIFAGHIAGITSIDTHNDERHLISNSKDQTIKLWDMRKFSHNDSIEEAKNRVAGHNWDYRWMPTPRSILQNRSTFDSDTSIRTYRGHTVRQTLIKCYFSPSFSTGQRYIYTGCSTGQVVIYDILTGNKVKYLKHKTRACIRDVAWHPFFPEIITTSWDTTVSRWYYTDRDVPVGSMRISCKKQPVRRSARLAARQNRPRIDSDTE